MSSSARWRHASCAAFTVLALLCTSALAGCSHACAPQGWPSSLRVQLTGAVDEVADVGLCVGDVCVPGEGEDPDPALLDLSGVTEHRAGNWEFTMLSTPAELTIRTYTAEGDVVTDTPVELEWHRVGGTARCGGPHAAVVTVEV